MKKELFRHLEFYANFGDIFLRMVVYISVIRFFRNQEEKSGNNPKMRFSMHFVVLVVILPLICARDDHK